PGFLNPHADKIFYFWLRYCSKNPVFFCKHEINPFITVATSLFHLSPEISAGSSMAGKQVCPNSGKIIGSN
ncbi:MAG: hypothetical protein SXA11_09065, partial [Cyanobacteriota bacterium]|nr:hypothetical protein [Cyanobacteriota bacterium]